MEEPAHNPSLKDKWIIDIESELEKTSPISSSWSICKVPINLRSVNEEAYTPRILSIGPIHHHQDKKFLRMEDHKRWYLNELFTRAGKSNEILGVFYDTILNLDKDVRACYAEPIVYDKQELAKILLYDAGFMLELFLRDSFPDSRKLDDPIFTTTWMIAPLLRDLALLENQIPFFVLESLFKLIAPPETAGITTLNELALNFFKPILNIKEEVFPAKCRQNGIHLLHLLYNCYLPSNPRHSRNEEAWEFTHSATSLRRAGVEFEENSTNDLLDLQFNNGTFKIPPLHIYDYTDSHFRNLMAFEQCQKDSKHYITSYIMVMDKLIDTTYDVELLKRKGIIFNELGGGDDVSNMFNNICKEIVLKDFYFQELCNNVNAYAKSPWPRNKAILSRKYFNNPWSITSFVAAVALILLTFLQTLYSMLSYHTS
ncbi:UPF0481 protein At3g47200-like [Tripterygium wilfordii]|uniref:UPF0481 protein At3g47200-like n=1 Tax=Tripterygium wilfordii TaxID=458696 RepID=UPI0018F80519|nr:UPF0481 protein At3g47200-like [Tripterygium wilfordii]